MLLGVIALGVASRTVLVSVPVIGKELGDMLWPVMFYLITVLLQPRLSPLAAAMIALVISMATEASQAYSAPWIDSLRDNRLGGIILGRHFSWRDMACYPIGTAIVWGADRLMLGATVSYSNFKPRHPF